MRETEGKTTELPTREHARPAVAHVGVLSSGSGMAKHRGEPGGRGPTTVSTPTGHAYPSAA